MALERWIDHVQPRPEVRIGRSFSPDEFAIALEQVVAGTAPDDYSHPDQFFSRTCFTRALCDHVSQVLRRLAGQTADTAPVLTLVTQFGGGKTHTLTTLYHLATAGPSAIRFTGVADLVRHARLSDLPAARVAVFVGNAWDPQPGHETPWLDVARQLAGDAGVAILGTDALNTPPGTTSLTSLFQAVGAPVLILFDEVLNFFNRHRSLAEPFYAFIQNLTVAATGTRQVALVISLPRSQTEMTDWDLQWQERITKVVHRVAKDLIANDESEISEVIRRRLFEDQGDERQRNRVAAAFAGWCFDRRAQLPPEWTAVDTATTESKAREFLESRFAACYPFHPATLAVFQRKWQALPQYQQTRSTLAMLAQWVSWAYRNAFLSADDSPLITLGSAPLHVPEFLSVVLGQLGDTKLAIAIDTDIAGQRAHARALDAEAHGPLQGIHRRVGTAIFFESSGGIVNKVAHLPELRFALGEPDLDTTSIDNAAAALESHAFYLRRIGTDGFQIRHQATLKKVVYDSLASLRDDEVRSEMHSVVKKEFDRAHTVPLVYFPGDSSEVADTPRLSLVVMSPSAEWGTPELRQQLAVWTRQCGSSARMYPAALIWCLRKPGRELSTAVESSLAWRSVRSEAARGAIGLELDPADRADLPENVRIADDAARDEVWAGYRYVVLADHAEPDGLKVIDLGAGHASASESLCGRVIAALKSQALLNESVGAGYIDRNWPPALKDAGAWPLASLRKSFLDGSLTRLLDPDTVLRTRITEFVQKGDFGLASGQRPDGTYERIWYAEPMDAAEVAFESGVYLLTKTRAKALQQPAVVLLPELPRQTAEPLPQPEPGLDQAPQPGTQTIRIAGTVPLEAWNRLGTKIIPKLKSGADVKVTVEFTTTVGAAQASALTAELKQALEDLALADQMKMEVI